MLLSFARSRLRPNALPATAEPPAPTIDASALVDSIGRQASTLGREAAEVRGLIGDAQNASSEQAQAISALAVQMQQVTRSQDAIGAQTSASQASVDEARAAVEAIGTEVSGIVDTLHDVSEAAAQIAQIALQTRLVAFNASVEAKRAGDAGRGFSVVADAVKDLASRVEVSSKDIMRTIATLDARIDTLAKEIRHHDGDTNGQGAFQRALARVAGGVRQVDEAATQSRGICTALNGQMSRIESEMQQTGRMLDAATRRSETFLTISEHLIEVVAECGIATEDTRYIEAARAAAAELGRMFDEAIASGTISAEALFDEDYRPIANTNPPQHMTRFVPLADELCPRVQEPMLALSDKVVFCIAVDRNGYVAAHNRKYCQPQRGDLAWDTANSRYRRIFNDRTGLASARNSKPFLLQTYRRDMGGGKFVVMKEAAAPVQVDGRHWGAIRLAFHF